MIVAMKKVSMVLLAEEQDESLLNLRDLGVIHIEKMDAPPRSLSLEKVQTEISAYTQALRLLPFDGVEAAPADSVADTNRSIDIRNRLFFLLEEQKRLQEELTQLVREEERLYPWGEFDPDDVEVLSRAGIQLVLLEVPPDEVPQLPEDLYRFEIERSKHMVRLAGFSFSNRMESDPRRVNFPEEGLATVRDRIAGLEKSLQRVSEDITALARERSTLVAALNYLDEAAVFETVKAGLGLDESLVFLNGFVPEDKVAGLKKEATEHSWALLVRDPEENESVPTLIKNPKWIKIIQPVFNFLGTMPGYKEFDVSFLFLSFLSLFFAMIIGDAGYGLVLLAIGTLVKLKQPRGSSSDILRLLMVMSVMTIIWGTLTGTWFGVKALADLPVLSWLRIDAISSFNENSAELIKQITFIIGTIHISIAHLVNFFRMLPSLKAYAQLGWFSLVLGLYYFVLNIVLDAARFPVKPLHLGMMGGGLLLVVLFSEQQGNFFKGVLRGLGSLPLKLLDGVGAFSDIISYIRLFAVGLATVEIAKSFNSMAADMGSGVVGLIAAVFVLVLGHSLNLAMGGLSVIVHGVRLKMLEFSGHMGMEWSGTPYEPFQIKRK